MSHETKKERKPPIVSGVIWLTLGIVLLLANMDAIEFTWPVLIIILGLALICGSFFKRARRRDEITPPPPPPPVP